MARQPPIEPNHQVLLPHYHHTHTHTHTDLLSQHFTLVVFRHPHTRKKYTLTLTASLAGGATNLVNLPPTPQQLMFGQPPPLDHNYPLDHKTETRHIQNLPILSSSFHEEFERFTPITCPQSKLPLLDLHQPHPALSQTDVAWRPTLELQHIFIHGRWITLQRERGSLIHSKTDVFLLSFFFLAFSLLYK